MPWPETIFELGDHDLLFQFRTARDESFVPRVPQLECTRDDTDESADAPPRRELVATLSLGTDLGLGQPMEHMIRACLIALRLGESFGLSEAERQTVYYSGLLAWVGCHTDAYEQAKWFGDELTKFWQTPTTQSIR